MLETADARLSTSTAEAVARELFGVEGDATPLSGERDQNFRLDAADGRRFVLKLSHSAEEAVTADFQTRALLHLARSGGVRAPRLLPGRDGEAQQTWRRPDGTPVTVRLLTFLPGRPLAEVAADDVLLHAVGEALARLDRAFRGFSHPGAAHDLLWDLANAARTRALLPAIATPDIRRRAEQGLDLFEAALVPATVRRQVIHNDLNPHNVLVRADRGEVTGVLDLGDAVAAPLVNDVAIAAAYHVRSGPDFLSGVAAVVRGYAGVLPLTEEETAALPGLIAGRLAMTLAISAWRAGRHPENRAYILRNAPAAVIGLCGLLDAPAGAAHARLRQAAGFAA